MGEVEAQLSAIEGVDVAVLVRKNHQNQNALAAYLTHKPGSDIATDAVREALKRELPEYMIPSSFTWLERMPLNAADKIDRHALPDPDFAGEIAEHYAKPQTEVERKLCAVWQTVLGQPRIGIDDTSLRLVATLFFLYKWCLAPTNWVFISALANFSNSKLSVNLRMPQQSKWLSPTRSE